MAFDEAEREFLDTRLIQPVQDIRLHQVEQNGSIAQALRGTELNARAVIEAKTVLAMQLQEAVVALPCVKRGEQLEGVITSLTKLDIATNRHEVNWDRVISIGIGALTLVINAVVLARVLELAR